MIFLCARACWPHAVSHVRCASQVNILYKPTMYLNYFDLYINIVILLYARTCWPLPYPMSVAHRKCKLNFNRLVLLIYVWTRWPHAVSHVHCVPQVNILFIPFKIIWIFI